MTNTAVATGHHKHPARHVTPRTWAVALLHSLSLPTSEGNVTVIEEWEAREGGNWLNNAKYNPLNTTQSEPGASSINSVGVKAYGSWQQGLQATRATLTNGLYAPILQALHRKDDKAAVTAIERSPWAGAGGYHTWPSAASGRAYATHSSPANGGTFVVHPEPFTLAAFTAGAGTPGNINDWGTGMKKWVAIIAVLVVVVLILKK